MTREQALARLLELWRAVPDPRLVPAIEEQSVALTATRKHPAGKTAKDKDAAWHALLDAGDPADLGVLLGSLPDTKQGRALLDRVYKLISVPADPRVADAALALLGNIPPSHGHTTRYNLKSHARRVLIAMRDPRSYEPLVAMGETDTAKVIGPKTPALDDAGLQALAEIRAAFADTHTAPRPETTAELYAAVYARPDDDAPRLVLADFLQQQGDPRGELIALQLARAAGGKRTQRERELLAAHTTEWLGDLAQRLRANVTFERGFLARCAVLATAPANAIIHPEMATVTAIDLEGWGFFPNPDGRDPLLILPALRSLRGLWLQHIPARRTFEELSIVHVGVEDAATLVARAGDWPGLRRLTLDVHARVDGYEALLASPLVTTQLEKLVLALGDDELWPWLPRLAQLPRRLRVEARARVGLEWELVLADRTLTVRPGTLVWFEQILPTLRAIVPSSVDKLVVHIGAKEPSAELLAAMAPFAKHELVRKDA